MRGPCTYHSIADRACVTCGQLGGPFQQTRHGTFRLKCRACYNASRRGAPRVRPPQELEAIARQQPFRRWTKAEVAALTKAVSAHVAWTRVQAAIYMATRSARSYNAVKNKAAELGLCLPSAGHFRVGELAHEIGLSPRLMTTIIDHRVIATKRDARGPLIAASEAERLIGMLPARWLMSRAVADRLGYTHSAISLMCKAGVLRGVKLGAKWYIDAAGVEEIEQRRAADPSFAPLAADLPYLNEKRAKLRERVRAIRLAARQQEVSA